MLLEIDKNNESTTTNADNNVYMKYMSDFIIYLYTMENLIKLLNEYRKEKYPKSKLRYYKYDSLNKEFLSNCIPNDSEEKVLGKRFWFVKRLVDNKKINFVKVKDNDDWYYIDLNDKYLDLLALLSIQDNPLDFLVKILK